MTRRTSIEVYQKIKSEGLLSALRFTVYECLFNYGPLSQMETCKYIGSKHQDRSIMPRFAELEKIGAIESIGEKKCSVTGRNVLIWDVTDRIPKKLIKEQKTKCLMCNGKGFLKQS